MRGGLKHLSNISASHVLTVSLRCIPIIRLPTVYYLENTIRHCRESKIDDRHFYLLSAQFFGFEIVGSAAVWQQRMMILRKNRNFVV